MNITCLFLSLHQPRTFREYYLFIFAMLTMSRKDVKYVNWPNLGELNFRVPKSETRRGLNGAFPMIL